MGRLLRRVDLHVHRQREAVLAGTAAGWQAAEARQLGDRLGLTPEGLRALGWIIEGDAEAGAVTPLRAS